MLPSLHVSCNPAVRLRGQAHASDCLDGSSTHWPRALDVTERMVRSRQSEGPLLRSTSSQLPLPASRIEGPRGRQAPETRRVLPTVGLFAGIGGIELGLQRAGHPGRMLCEIDGPARAVLEHRFPEVEVHDDVCTLGRLPKDAELLAGGFPCQDLSQAGKTAGIAGARSGLIGQVFRLVDKHRVPWLLLENVPFMLQLGRGQALDVIIGALERFGYQWAYRVVDTRSFGLPQRRRRVIIVASLDDDPRRVLFADEAGAPEEPVPDGSLACGFYWTEGIRGLGWAVDAIPTLKGGSTVGVPSPPAIWMPDGSVVTPHIRDAERLQGFRKDWTKAAERVARPSIRWKLVGNAVSAPVGRWVGERLAAPGDFELRDVRRLPQGSPWPTAAWNTGDGRCSAPLSEFPKRAKRKHLHDFLLDEPSLLSEKATAGFLSRTRRSKLRFPAGFIAAIEAHLRRMTTGGRRPSR
jgi:DNA (cytosine-5)-methyltransferase 1